MSGTGVVFTLPLQKKKKKKKKIPNPLAFFLNSLSNPICSRGWCLGPYRSGKSYLLTKLLGKKGRGFEVSGTVNACTKVTY